MNRKQFLAILFYCTIVVCAKAQSPVWEWAKSGSGLGSDRIQAVCSDDNSNVYGVGYYDSPTLSFENLQLSHTAGNHNFFLSKHDNQGNSVWLKRIRANGYAEVNAICADKDGNVYVAGSFERDSIIFDGIVLFNNSSSIYRNIFIVKYNIAGNVVSSKLISGDGFNFTTGLYLGEEGALYVTGNFMSTGLDFGGITLVGVQQPCLFLAKYDLNLNLKWAKCSKGNSNVATTEGNIAGDKNGNVFITGGFYGPSFILGIDTLQNFGAADYDAFVVKYDSSGDVLWTHRSVGNGSGISSISADAAGSIYIYGSYFGDSIIFAPYTLTNKGYRNLFLTKYESNGDVSWAKTYSGPGDVNNNSITAVRGYIYTTGSFTESIAIDSITVDSTGSRNFIAKFDTSGRLDWVSKYGSGNSDVMSASTKDSYGNFYVGGYFYSSSLVLSNSTLINTGSTNVFVAKLYDPTIGFEELKTSNTVSIYPNPSSGIVRIDGLQPGSTVDVCDIVGRSVYTGAATDRTIVIDLSNQLNGVYLYSVTAPGGQRLAGKIVRD